MHRQLENQAPNTTDSNHLYNTLELLMMGIIVTETCWASNKICNKNHLLHLVGILFPHIKEHVVALGSTKLIKYLTMADYKHIRYLHNSSRRRKHEKNKKCDDIITFPAYEIIYKDITLNNAPSCILFFKNCQPSVLLKKNNLCFQNHYFVCTCVAVMPASLSFETMHRFWRNFVEHYVIWEQCNAVHLPFLQPLTRRAREPKRHARNWRQLLFGSEI
jgi:hypothetical protein